MFGLVKLKLPRDEEALAGALSPFCKKVIPGNRVVYAVPKDSVYKEIYVYARNFGLGFEKKYMFTGRLIIVSSKEMDEKGARLYRALKPLECEVKWRGFPRRRPVFEPFKFLYKLEPRLEGFHVSKELADRFNRDEKLLEAIRKIDAVEVVVALNFLGRRDVQPLDPNPKIAALMSFYLNPEDVMWEPVVSVVLTRGPTFKKKVENTLWVLERIGSILKDFSEEAMARLG